jgi:hypothetical protein
MLKAVISAGVLALMFVLPVGAQQLTIYYVEPPHPTTADQVVLGIESCGQTLVGLQIVGHLVEIQTQPGPTTCGTPLPIEVHLGRLFPGTYTARIRYTGPSGVVMGPERTFEVTVAPQDVPTVHPSVRVALGVMLSVAGVVALRKVS